MNPLPSKTNDAELIKLIDQWAALLEAEDYQAAYDYTDHIDEMGWTPDVIRDVIKSYGDAEADQRVTVFGASTDIHQRKEVDRWVPNTNGDFGEIWYDLNINGILSDLTATFTLREVEEGVIVILNNIHVM